MKKVIKLTESDLRRLVMEAVQQLNESEHVKPSPEDLYPDTGRDSTRTWFKNHDDTPTHDEEEWDDKRREEALALIDKSMDESITRAIRKHLHEEAAGDAVKGDAGSALKGAGGDILGSVSGDVMQGVSSGEIGAGTAKKFLEYVKNYNMLNPVANIKNYINFFKSLNPTEKKVLIKIALKYGLKLPIK